MKYCKRCDSEKEESKFYKSKGTLSPYCKKCTKEYRRERRKNNPELKEKQNRRRRERRRSDPEYRRKINKQKRKHFRNRITYYKWISAKQRAEERGLEFTIEEEDIEIPEYCPLLGVKIEVGTRDNYEYSPSLDRKDPTKGYTKDNIWVISKKANSMKNSATLKEIKTFYKNLIKHLE